MQNHFFKVKPSSVRQDARDLGIKVDELIEKTLKAMSSLSRTGERLVISMPKEKQEDLRLILNKMSNTIPDIENISSEVEEHKGVIQKV